MLKIENTEVVGWEAAIRGMRNPKNSWARSDSGYSYIPEIHAVIDDKLVLQDPADTQFCIGENDWSLMTSLRNAGTDHRKYMRMIAVYADITAPLYWLKEYDTYKVGTVANSCSTMHKIADKEFTADDFSVEHLLAENVIYFGKTIERLNTARTKFIETKNKDYWWQMIQLLPSSYNQKRTIMLNYEVLANMYKSRKNHKLDEWHTFCDWIKTLPYSQLITGEADKEE
nr:hypothetical protein DGKKSRWO_DGKKSRWO_CDS_0145 [uncultured phage]CAI9752322.1 hypothetical protein CVNMHQAP_CVNMHQAP_CDS_0145 [uncultured phage]